MFVTICKTTERHNPEDHNSDTHSREKFEFHYKLLVKTLI
jgi:hypothetical protein